MPGTDLESHDIALPLATEKNPITSHNAPARQLRFVLLSPLDVTNTKLPATIQRIRTLGKLTGGIDVAIIFVQTTPRDTHFHSAKQLAQETYADQQGEANMVSMAAYARLRAELIALDEASGIPILFLAEPEGLPDLLKEHRNARATQDHRHRTRKATQSSSASARELLQLCTANPPMPEETAYLLSDIFPNLRSLAESCMVVSSPPTLSSPYGRASEAPTTSHYFQTQGEGTDSHPRGQWQPACDPRMSDAHRRLTQLRDLVGIDQCEAVMEFWKTEYTPA